MSLEAIDRALTVNMSRSVVTPFGAEVSLDSISQNPLRDHVTPASVSRTNQALTHQSSDQFHLLFID